MICSLSSRESLSVLPYSLPLQTRLGRPPTQKQKTMKSPFRPRGKISRRSLHQRSYSTRSSSRPQVVHLLRATESLTYKKKRVIHCEESLLTFPIYQRSGDKHMYVQKPFGNLISISRRRPPVVHASHDENCRVSAIFNTCTGARANEGREGREPKYDDALHLRFCLAIINGNPWAH